MKGNITDMYTHSKFRERETETDRKREREREARREGSQEGEREMHHPYTMNPYETQNLWIFQSTPVNTMGTCLL